MSADLVATSTSETLPVLGDGDVVRARQAVRVVAIAAGLSLVDQTKVVTAASELARNAVLHGGGGSVTVEAVTDGRRRGVRAVFVDAGEGIPDVGLALRDGFTTKGGMGLGLSGTRRLVDHFELETAVGGGTRVEIVKWAR